MSIDPNKIVERYEGVFKESPSHTPTNGEPDGALLGNGDIGVVCGLTESQLTFWISKNDLWYSGCDYQAGERICGVRGLGTIRIGSTVFCNAEFSARQVIATADVIITLKNADYSLCVSVYAPYQNSVILFKLEALKGDIPMTADLLPLEDSAAECRRWEENNLVGISKNYVKNVEWETKSVAFCRTMGWNQTDGVLHEGEQTIIAVSVYTNHDTQDYWDIAKADVERITPTILKEYRKSHLKWWENFWNTSGISIPSEPEIEKLWYGSHYLMACCCKEGKFAPGIFGSWITTNKPNWNGDYHLNYNYQAPWWGVFSSNKVFLSAPYDRPLMDYIPQARINSQRELSCHGIYSKVGIGPKGIETSRMVRKDGTEDKMIPYWGQKSNAAYAAINMIMRFYYTWDEEYARKYALPYLLEVADFWEDYLKFENGRYVVYKDCIHENSALARGVLDWADNDVTDYSSDMNPILTLGLLRVVFKGLLDISTYLGAECGRREKWTHIFSLLSDFPIQIRDGKTVFRYTEVGMDWCESNSLGIQHIYPCGTVGLWSSKDLLEIAQNTVEAMHRWSDYNAFPTFFTAAVRVGYDPKVILGKLKDQIISHSFPNMFIYYGGGGIECCSAVPSCVNEMLFQSHENILHFFAVWDMGRDASFYRLRAYGAFLVSADLKDGIVQKAEIFSEKGRSCSILSPWASGATVLEDGYPHNFVIENIENQKVITFHTKAGANYELHSL